MKTKVPKHVKEIILQVSATKGLIVKYIKEKPKKVFSNPVDITSKKKSSPDDLIFFKLMGTKFCVNSAEHIKKLRILEDCCEVTVKHEFKNKHDEFACAVYYKKMKLGYIPKEVNKEFIAKAQKRIKFKFFVCNLSTFNFEDSVNYGPLVVAIRQRK